MPKLNENSTVEVFAEKIGNILYKLLGVVADGEKGEEATLAILELIDAAYADGYQDGMQDEAMAQEQRERQNG